jgi:hypothetical protein
MANLMRKYYCKSFKPHGWVLTHATPEFNTPIAINVPKRDSIHLILAFNIFNTNIWEVALEPLAQIFD